MYKLSSADVSLLNLLKKAMFGYDEPIEIASLKDTYDNCTVHSVIPLCFDSLSGLRLDDTEVYAEWRNDTVLTLIKNDKIMRIQQQLCNTFKQHGIKMYVIKGCSAAYYYKRPELRMLGDIDIFTNIEDFNKACSLLEKSKFKLISTTNYHYSYVFDDIEVELHRSLHALPDNGIDQHVVEILSTGGFSEKTIDNYSFSMPNVDINALVQLLHMQEHLQNGGLGIRQVCDWAAIRSSRDYIDNKQKIDVLLEDIGLVKFEKCFSAICRKYLGMPLKEHYSNEVYSLADDLICDIMQSGNFGAKSQEIYFNSSIFVAQNNGKNGLAAIISNYIEFAYKSFPICKRYMILVPFSPLVIIPRYIYRVIRRRRVAISPLKMAKSAKERASIYKKLEIFKVK